MRPEQRSAARDAATLPDDEYGRWKGAILTNVVTGGGVVGFLLVVFTCTVAVAAGVLVLEGVYALMRAFHLKTASVPEATFLIFSIPVALVFFNAAAPVFFRLHRVLRSNGRG